MGTELEVDGSDSGSGGALGDGWIHVLPHDRHEIVGRLFGCRLARQEFCRGDDGDRKPARGRHILYRFDSGERSDGKSESRNSGSWPKRAATIYVDARKMTGQWHFDHLIIQIQRTGARIDLSDK